MADKKIQEQIDIGRPFLGMMSGNYGRYYIAQYDTGEFQLARFIPYEDGLVPIGKVYKEMIPISNERMIGGREVFAIYAKSEKSEGYISTIDNEQTLLNSETDAIIMSSFISHAYQNYKKFVSNVINGHESRFVELDYDNLQIRSNEGMFIIDGGNLIFSPIGTEIEPHHYNEEICSKLATRFYGIMEEYKNQVNLDTTLTSEQKTKLINEVLPMWEELTLRDLYYLNSKLKSNNQVKINESESIKTTNSHKELENVEFKLTDQLSSYANKEILEIIKSNHKANGGTLQNDHILPHDYNLIVELDGKIIGYAALKDKENNELYVSLIAIDKRYQGMGIASKIYEFLKKNTKQYTTLTADVRITNIGSQKLHKKQGFVLADLPKKRDLVWNEHINHRYSFDLETVKDRKPFKMGITEKPYSNQENVQNFGE